MWHFCRKSSDRTAPVREVTRTNCSQVVKIALLSEVFRQDVREVTRTDCRLMARMALSSEGFRQDVREANENRLQSGCKCGTFVGRVPTGRHLSEKSQEQTAVRLLKDCTFVGSVPTGCQRSHKNRLQSDGEDCTFIGRVPTGL
jgi:hypothetical protein